MAVRTVRADVDADIGDIAALDPADGNMLYWATGGTRYNLTASASYGRGLLAYASEAALKAGINAEAGVDFVGYNGALGTPSSGDASAVSVTPTGGSAADTLNDWEAASAHAVYGLTALRDVDVWTSRLAFMLYRSSALDGGGGFFRWASGDQSAVLINQTISIASVDTSNDRLTSTAHGFVTGNGVLASAADAGLSTNTLYYVSRYSANEVSLHTTAADAFAGTNKVNITSLGGSLSLKRLADPGQGIYVTRTGAALDGSAGAWMRVLPGGPYQAAWWGMWASATAAVNTLAIRHAFEALPITADAAGVKSEGGELLLPDGIVSIADETLVFDGKSFKITGAINTKLGYTFTGSKPVIIVGRSSYSSSEGYFVGRFRGFGMDGTGHTHCFKTYIRTPQFDYVRTFGSSTFDYHIIGGWLDGHIRDCLGQGGSGGGVLLSDFSNNIAIQRGRFAFYTGLGPTIHVYGVTGAKIDSVDIEYNVNGILLEADASSYLPNATGIVNCWIEGQTGYSIRVDNTAHGLDGLIISGGTYYGDSGTADSGRIELGVSGGTGVIDGARIIGLSLSGPSTTQLYFPCARSAYRNVQYTVAADNAFGSGIGVGAASLPELETYPAFREYTVTLDTSSTDYTKVNGTIKGYYSRVGNRVRGRILHKVGSSDTVGAGVYNYSLPFTAKTLDFANAQFLGQAYVRDASAPAETYAYTTRIYSGGSTVFFNSAGGGSGGASNPYALATDDEIVIHFDYEAA